MYLEGSCHCGSVQFSLESGSPYPYQRCYCSICRKQQGGGGYAVNLGGDAKSLKVAGGENISVYRAIIRNPGEAERVSNASRSFCNKCGTALWLSDPDWPELVHPFASAIDTPLPPAPEHTHIMLEFKPDWVPLEAGPRDKKFDRYPEESLSEWHQRLGVSA